MKWFFPSWNGDIRIVADPDDPELRSLLIVHEPTALELEVLREIRSRFVQEGWCDGDSLIWRPDGPSKQTTSLTGQVAEMGPVVAALLRPGHQTLTQVVMDDGSIRVVEGSGEELQKAVAPQKPGIMKRLSNWWEGRKETKAKRRAELKELQARVAAEEEARQKARREEEARRAEAEPKPKKAVTVKRPTPCCPACIEGPVDPATEVLLHFLTPSERRSWERDHAIEVEGGTTGVRYLLAHRHTPLAQKIGRICYSLDDRCVVHFHDNTVPPAEEVLAAKIILEHREAWLRNEATMLGFGHRFVAPVLKNPFGDGGDGVWDSMFSARVGRELLAALRDQSQ